MPDAEINTTPARTKERSIPTASAVLSDGSLVEMLYQPENHRTLLCHFKNGVAQFVPSVMNGSRRLVPYSAGNNLLLHEVVLFPSEPLEYGSDHELVSEIKRIRQSNPGHRRAVIQRAGVNWATSDRFLSLIPGSTASR